MLEMTTTANTLLTRLCGFQQRRGQYDGGYAFVPIEGIRQAITLLDDKLASALFSQRDDDEELGMSSEQAYDLWMERRGFCDEQAELSYWDGYRVASQDVQDASRSTGRTS